MTEYIDPIVPVIFGTAGHIDHGKSSLIKALTGTDPDRLKEEKQRGITIELGFAFLNDQIAFIDVPGHEKFIRHMVAGAATVDYAMLIVAADDGVMPQTREHLDILDLLDVQGGLVVITKADLAEPDFIELVREEIEETILGTVLHGAPVYVADSLSGRGVTEVRDAIQRIASTKRLSGGRGVFRLPIDRVFSIKGFGTVVTGSALSGSANLGDKLELLPEQRIIRIKGLQSQGQKTDRVVAGQRAAINLASISTDEVHRGEILASPETLRPVHTLHAKLQVLPSCPIPLKNRQRIHLHLGTADIIARVSLLEEGPVQPGAQGFGVLHLESPTAAQRLDRFIMRRYSPLLTIGGGVILNANPPKKRHKKSQLRNILAKLDSQDLPNLLKAALENAPFSTASELSVAISHPLEEVKEAVESLLLSGGLFAFEIGEEPKLCPASLFEQVLQVCRAELKTFHESKALRLGMSLAELCSKIARRLPKGIPSLFIEQAVKSGFLRIPAPGFVSLIDFEVHLTRKQEQQVSDLIDQLDRGGLMPPSVEEQAQKLNISSKECRVLLTYLVDTQRALCLDNDLFFSTDNVHEAGETLLRLLQDKPQGLTVSEIREALNSTRKYTIPLLEYYDAKGFTRRDGDTRKAGTALQKSMA